MLWHVIVLVQDELLQFSQFAILIFLSDLLNLFEFYVLFMFLTN